MAWSRISWITISLICIFSAIGLLLGGYSGYSAVLVAIGAAAAVNLL